jgi:hypothetical protein
MDVGLRERDVGEKWMIRLGGCWLGGVVYDGLPPTVSKWVFRVQRQSGLFRPANQRKGKRCNNGIK